MAYKFTNPNKVPDLVCRVTRAIRFEELDPMNVVWHGRYPSFFEDAREALGNKFGLSYTDMKNQGFMVPIREINIEYIKHPGVEPMNTRIAAMLVSASLFNATAVLAQAAVDDALSATNVSGLVVTTAGVNYPYLDAIGTPLSDAVQLTERFTLAEDGNRLNYSMTATDPSIYTQPVTLERFWRWAPEIAYEAFDCGSWAEAAE